METADLRALRRLVEETYDESRYLNALNEKNAPLLEKPTGLS